MFSHRRYVLWTKNVVAIQVAQQIIRGWYVLILHVFHCEDVAAVFA